MSQDQNQTPACIGLDIGTSRIVAMSGGDQPRVASQLNAFVTLPHNKLTEASLRREGIPHAVADGQITVFGNESARLCDLLGRDLRRPMTQGMLNPHESSSMGQIEALLAAVLEGTPKDARLCFSVPAAPLGGGADGLSYHEATLRQMLTRLGYLDVRSLNEAVAVIYSELEEANYTGIGVSCGGGLCNVALAYLSVPVLTFSVSKAGDFIDAGAAAAVGELANRVRLIKEETFHFDGQSDKLSQALKVYYDEMIRAVVEGLAQALAGSRNVPRFGRPVPLVLSGGGVLPAGFRERFEAALLAQQLPVEVSEVRLAEKPLEATARGALRAALSE
jgi:hypothetical protein